MKNLIKLSIKALACAVLFSTAVPSIHAGVCYCEIAEGSYHNYNRAHTDNLEECITKCQREFAQDRNRYSYVYDSRRADHGPLIAGNIPGAPALPGDPLKRFEDFKRE
jgi:hypothetical protein